METKNRFDNLPIIALAVGFGLYVAVDSGVFKNWKFPARSTQEMPSLSKEEQDLQNLKKEIADATRLTKEKRQKIKSLLQNLDEIDKTILTESKEISSIEKKFKAVKTKPQTRTVAAVPKKVGFDPGFELTSWSDVITIARENPKLELQVDTLSDDGGQFLRFLQDRPFSDGSIYMRGVGLKMASLVALGVQKLNADKVFVTFDKEDRLTTSRVEVLKTHLSQLLGTQVEVESQKISSGSSNSSSGIEIRVKLKNG